MLDKYSPGDHIKAWRPIHRHHGIYVGSGRVIHYLEKGVGVKETDFYTFSDNQLTELVHHDNPRYSPSEVIERAYSRLKEDNYSLIFNNCEHFCNWCIDGESKSDQVKTAGRIAAETVLVPCAVAAEIIVELSNSIKEHLIERPHRDLTTVTESINSAAEVNNELSNNILLGQQIFSEILKVENRLDNQIHNKFNNIDNIGHKTLEIINKI
jgi:hypothetical protein